MFLGPHWEVTTHLVDMAEVEWAHTDNARNLFLKVKAQAQGGDQWQHQVYEQILR